MNLPFMDSIFVDFILLQNFELAHHGSVNDVAFSPSEARVASAGGDSFIKVIGIAAIRTYLIKFS